MSRMDAIQGIGNPWLSAEQKVTVEAPRDCDGTQCSPTLPYDFLPKRFSSPDEARWALAEATERCAELWRISIDEAADYLWAIMTDKRLATRPVVGHHAHLVVRGYGPDAGPWLYALPPDAE